MYIQVSKMLLCQRKHVLAMPLMSLPLLPMLHQNEHINDASPLSNNIPPNSLTQNFHPEPQGFSHNMELRIPVAVHA